MESEKKSEKNTCVFI